MAEQTTHLPKHCPTCPHFASSEACCPEPSPEPSRPSPWCQLPASVFPAAPGSGSYSCPRAEGAALQGSGASSQGPRSPHVKRGSGLPLPARGRSFAAACPSSSVHPLLPAPLLVALGIGGQQGPKERRRCLGLARVPCSMGLQQASLGTVVELERTLSFVFWWMTCKTLSFQNPASREFTVSALGGYWSGGEDEESWDWDW